MDPRLQAIYNELNAVYDPQRQAVEKQRPLVDQEYQTGRTALEQAKTNAFTDISNQSNRSGMFFSGFRPEEQARYTGTKYLPAVANLEQGYAQKKLSLEDQLNRIKLSQDSSARSILQKQIEEENRAREAEAKRQQALQIARMRISASNARSAANNQGKGFSIGYKPNNAGYMFKGPNGRPVSMYEYAANTGAPMVDLLRQSPSQYDRNALNYLNFYRSARPNASEQDQLNYLRTNFPALF